MYLGPFETPASCENYDRFIAEYLTSGRNVDLMPSVMRRDRFCVIDLIGAFKGHAESYYVKDGEPTKTLANLRIGCRRLRELYDLCRWKSSDLPSCGRSARPGSTTVTTNALELQGHLDQARLPVGVEHELVSGETWHRLEAVRSLKKGRSRAKPSNVQGPVPHEDVDRTLRP
ncbi:MAG: hypothetical protein AAGH71_07525 [Planctomycetota bacterium]